MLKNTRPQGFTICLWFRDADGKTTYVDRWFLTDTADEAKDRAHERTTQHVRDSLVYVSVCPGPH